MKITLVLSALFVSTMAFAGNPQNGKKLFTDRSCNACHSVGIEGTAQTGPNLAGVTQRRDQSWLRKWLKNPDAMRDDPTIKKMDSKYHATMPNLGLEASDIDDLLAYLESVGQKSKKK